MDDFDLNVDDINEIMKDNLKIVNQVKSIKSIFLNKRFMEKINYEPYFQRKYVWDNEKASYFIESIILGTEIPPLVLFQTKELNEVIDGRQRFETIEKFINDKIILNEKGLKVLTTLSGRKFSQLSSEIRDSIENTKIRILQCSVVNEPNLTEDKEDKIKKEIFRRYNSGISTLKKPEIDRAQYINDDLTNAFKKMLESNKDVLKDLISFFLPVRSMKASSRDKINILLSKIRTFLVLPKIPIENYLSNSNRANIIQVCYYHFFQNINCDQTVDDFIDTIEDLKRLREYIAEINDSYYSNHVLFEICFWGLSILRENNITITSTQLENMANIIMHSSDTEYLWEGIEDTSKDIDSLFDLNNTYYRKGIIERHTFLKNYIEEIFKLDLSTVMKNKNYLEGIVSNSDIQNVQFEKYKLHKPDPSSITIFDILDDMKGNKFLIRPNYQRSETANVGIASYLLESVFLDIKIPPIFIYKREDKVKEVVDGQQRLLTFLGFLGKSYVDENGLQADSKKNKFKINGVSILKDLNGKNKDTIDERYINKLLDFPLDIVEIDQSQNENFDTIDLFLRLNTKPYPIINNSFEMWNAYIEKELTQQIKNVATKYGEVILRKSNKRMKNEELVASLAYLDYEVRNNNGEISNLLNIYVKNNKVCSRISRKDKITKCFKEILKNDDMLFKQSVENVNLFFNKINILIGNNENNFAELFSDKKANSSAFKSDQNFYFLWIMLDEINAESLMDNKRDIMNMVFEKNKMLQNYCADSIYNMEEFLISLRIK